MKLLLLFSIILLFSCSSYSATHVKKASITGEQIHIPITINDDIRANEFQISPYFSLTSPKKMEGQLNKLESDTASRSNFNWNTSNFSGGLDLSFSFWEGRSIGVGFNVYHLNNKFGIDRRLTIGKMYDFKGFTLRTDLNGTYQTFTYSAEYLTDAYDEKLQENIKTIENEKTSSEHQSLNLSILGYGNRSNRTNVFFNYVIGFQTLFTTQKSELFKTTFYDSFAFGLIFNQKTTRKLLGLRLNYYKRSKQFNMQLFFQYDFKLYSTANNNHDF